MVKLEEYKGTGTAITTKIWNNEILPQSWLPR